MHSLDGMAQRSLFESVGPPRIPGFSLLQPWASLMALGAKQIETRSWYTKYRGDVAIASSKRWNTEDLELAIADRAMLRVWNKHGIRQMRELPLGAILSVQRLVACVPTETVIALDAQRDSASLSIAGVVCNDDELCFGNYAPGRWAWIYESPRRLESPIPVKGMYGLYKLPEPVLHAICGQLTA
jgi:hypothetical protein